MSVLLQRARDSGKCPPSLLSEDGVVADDSFDKDVLQVLDDGKNKLLRSLLLLLLKFRVLFAHFLSVCLSLVSSCNNIMYNVQPNNTQAPCNWLPKNES